MPKELSTTLTDALVAVLTVAIPIVGAFVVNWLKAHTSQKNLDTIARVGGVAVKAVEQMYGDLSGPDKAVADAKLNAAKQRARDIAAKVGISLTDEQLRSVIESAVHEINQDKAILLPAEPVTPAVLAPAVSVVTPAGVLPTTT